MLTETDSPTLLVVTRRSGGSVRVRRLPDGVYEVEHAEGDRRRQLYTSDLRLVWDVLASWIGGDGWWRDAVAWADVDPAVAELDALRAEMAHMLDDVPDLDGLTGELDAALSRADELLRDLS